jgi:hypothetical protein
MEGSGEVWGRGGKIIEGNGEVLDNVVGVRGGGGDGSP